MNVSFDENEAFVKNFKIALATAIVRKKPKDIAAKDYAKQLSDRLRKSEETWHQKAKELEQKLLSSKQELLHLKLKYEHYTKNGSDAQSEEKEQQNVSKISNEQDNNTVELEDFLTKNTQFLKSVVTLGWYSKASGNTLDDVKVVKSILLNSLKVLKTSIASLELNYRLLETLKEHLPAIKELLSAEPLKDDIEINQAALDFVGDMIKKIMNRNDIGNYMKQQKLSEMVVLLGKCQPLTQSLLGKMTILIRGYSDVLRGLQQQRCLIQADKFENIYYILWIIEELLKEIGRDPKFPQSVKEGIIETMQDCLLELTESFPLFAHYVWRLMAILEAYEFANNAGQEENIWAQRS